MPDTMLDTTDSKGSVKTSASSSAGRLAARAATPATPATHRSAKPATHRSAKPATHQSATPATKPYAAPSAPRFMRAVFLTVTMLSTALFTALWVCTTASAQEFGRMNDQVATGTSYRIFARPGDATVQVVVVASQGSGVYEVAPNTDLGALVALSGGLEAQGQTGVKSSVTVRLLRKEADGRRRVVYTAPIEQMLIEPDAHPELLEGDVLTVDRVTRQSFGWRDALSIGTAAGTIALTLRSILGGG